MVKLRKSPKWKTDQCTLKLYGTDGRYSLKLVHHNRLRTAGLEDVKEVGKAEKGTVNDSKLEVNIARAKSMIQEIADCNEWDWFGTFTIDGSKYARDDLTKFHRSFTQFIRDFGKKHGTKVAYLLVPELHKDGKSWHMHGFLKGIPVEVLHRFQVGDRMGSVIAQRVTKGVPVYNWVEYMKRFGFCDLEPIQDQSRASSYIRKYITKELARTVTKLGAHMYYATQGLKRAELIASGTYPVPPEWVPTYENEFCQAYCFEYSPELMQDLLNSFVTTQDYITVMGKPQELRLLEAEDYLPVPF